MKSEILNTEFEYTTTHLYLHLDEETLWLSDKFSVMITSKEIGSIPQVFEYSMGVGHRKPINKRKVDEIKNLKNRNFKKTYSNMINVKAKYEACSIPTKPNIDDVLYSLVMDSRYLYESFDDWCDNFGYDSDSKKAFSIYEDCIKNAKKLKALNININEASEAFQDY